MSKLIDAEKLAYEAECCIETTDGFIDLIERQPTEKAVTIEQLEMLLKGMRIDIGRQEAETASGYSDYFVGYKMAISYIEGWLAEQEGRI